MKLAGINLFICLGILLSSCEAFRSDDPCTFTEVSSTEPVFLKILFIGNSYTYTNNIPQVIQKMAHSAGDSAYVYQETPVGYSLKWHTTRKSTLYSIHSDKWDFVILQGEGGTQAMPPFMADTGMYRYAEMLINEIRENSEDTRIMFYMTHAFENGVLSWGARDWCEQDPLVCDYGGMQKRVKDNYVIMADRFGAEVAPAGVVWKYMLDENPNLDLFAEDGIHATPEGSYISACCLYSAIFRKKPTGKHYPFPIEEDIALKIQQKVTEVMFSCTPDWMDY